LSKIETPRSVSLRDPSEVIDEWVHHTFLWYIKKADPILKIGHAKLKAKLRERYTKIAVATDNETRERWDKMITMPGLVKEKKPRAIEGDAPRQAVVGDASKDPEKPKFNNLLTQEEIINHLADKGLAK